jgi:uncharacterized protein with LGFP repeats
MMMKRFLMLAVVAAGASLGATGAIQAGPIQGKWADLGRDTGFLGAPTSGENNTPDRPGRYMHFDGGSIYWSPRTGAHEVHGDIRGKWSDLGWERSFLGFPETDETSTPDGIGRFNHFEGGSIYWTPRTGAHEVHGEIRDRWASMGWERGFLGYPISDELPTRDGVGRVSYFQGGAIHWRPGRGTWVERR